MNIKIPVWVKSLLYAALAAAVFYASWRWLIPALLPLIAALLLAKLCEPAVLFMREKLRMPRQLSALIITLTLTSALGAAVFLAVSRAVYETRRLLKHLPELMTKLPQFSTELNLRIEAAIVAAPEEMQEFLRGTADQIINKGVSVPSEVYSALAGALAGAAAFIPNALLFGTALIFSLFFISADFPKVAEVTRKLLPKPAAAAVRGAGGAFMKWLYAQGILSLLTGAAVLAGLLMLRTDYALLFAALTAAVDFLPALGSGVTLIPLAAFQLITGEGGRALGVIVLWLTVVTVRAGLEPKMVGGRLGLHPAVSLASMYAGFKLFGIAGMVLFPIAAVVAAGYVNGRE